MAVFAAGRVGYLTQALDIYHASPCPNTRLVDRLHLSEQSRSDGFRCGKVLLSLAGWHRYSPVDGFGSCWQYAAHFDCVTALRDVNLTVSF
jgi:hypothetical protein